MELRQSVLSILKAHFSTLAYRGACTKALQDLAYMFEVLVWVVRVDRDVI